MGWRILVLFLLLLGLLIMVNYLDAVGQLSIGSMLALFAVCVFATYFIVKKKI